MSFSNASDVVCSLSIPKFGIPREQNFMPSSPCFNYKIKNVQQVVRQLYLLISLQILRIKINKTELNKEKKGKHSGITVCSDSYKNEKKS